MNPRKYLEKVLRLGALLGLLGGLFILMPPLAVSGTDNGSPGGPEFAPDHILVKFKAGTSEATRQDTHRRHQGSVERELTRIGVQVVRVPRGQVLRKVRDYARERAVEFAEPDYVVRKMQAPNDPYFDQQWGMSKILAPEAWAITPGSPAVKIAILDTGIDQDHADLLGKIADQANFTTSPTVDDVDGHGTHVAGIAAAATNNSLGVAGVGRDSRLMNGKVLDDNGVGTWEWVARGILWAVDPDGNPGTDDGARVINMSLGGPIPSDTVRDAISYAWNNYYVVLVAAAGNSGTTMPSYPAYYSNVIAVAATNPDDTQATFSTYGNWVDVAAPGVNIFSTLPNQNYGYLNGTSMASPHVAGLAALVWATPWGSDNISVRKRIERLADPVGSFVAYGRINAFAAVGDTPTPTLESIAVTPGAASIEVGFTQQFTATGTFSGGRTANLTATARWDSSDNLVATVNASGLAKGEAEGTAVIAASQDGIVSNGATLTVTPQTSAPRIFADGFESGISPPWDFAWPTSGASSIVASPEQQKEGSYSAKATLAAGDRAALAYKLLPDTYGTLYLRTYLYVGNYDTTGDSTSEMIVLEETVSSKIKIFLGLRDFGGPPWPLYLVYGSNNVVAVPGASIAPGTWYSVELAAYRSSSQGWIKVWVNNGDANSPNLVWTGNTGSGGFNRVRVGFFGPRASAPTAAYWDSVVVAESFIGPLQEGPPPTLVSIDVAPGAASIQQGATQQFTATGTYSDGSTANLTTTADWASSDILVATINASGLATGIAPGSADITATQDGVLSNSATLTVTPPPSLLSIDVTPTAASIPQGTTQQFTATGTYSDGSTADLTTTATWASSDILVATVNASGLATGIAPGSADITATQDGVVSNIAALTVTAPPPPGPSIFADGFESGNLAAWTASWVSSGASSVAASPEQKREGSYSGKATLGVNDNAALLYKDLPATYSTLYMRAYLYVDSYDTSGDSTSEMIVLGAGSSKIFLGLRDFGGPPWPLYMVYGNNVIAVPGVSIAPGTWYSVELAAYRSSQGWIKVWVNNGDANSPNLVWTGNTGSGGFNRVRVGFFGPRASTTTVAFWDAVVVAESFIGPLPDSPP